MARSTPAWPGRRHQPAGCHWRRCWRAAPRAHACWRCTRGKTAPAPRLQHTRTRAASVRFPLSLPSTWPDGGAPAPDQVLLRSTERRPLLAALRPRTAALSARSSHGARVARAVVTLDGAGSNAAELRRAHTATHVRRLFPPRAALAAPDGAAANHDGAHTPRVCARRARTTTERLLRYNTATHRGPPLQCGKELLARARRDRAAGCSRN